MKKKKKQENYLDRVPVINDKKWELTDDGLVEVTVENTGFYNTIAQKFFKRPRYSFIRLDEYGSCVWQQIDGTKNIYEIGQILKIRTGERPISFMRGWPLILRFWNRMAM